MYDCCTCLFDSSLINRLLIYYRVTDLLSTHQNSRSRCQARESIERQERDHPAEGRGDQRTQVQDGRHVGGVWGDAPRDPGQDEREDRSVQW